MPIFKSEIKHLKSLQLKKYRNLHQLFIVEGQKMLLEVLKSSFPFEKIFITESFFEANKDIFKKCDEFQIIQQDILSQISTLNNNQFGLAVLKYFENISLTAESNELVLVLDDIQDPGNFGTILRIADWYGIKKIVCSQNTVDLYNPKVIAASMGSFLRVRIFYTNLDYYLESLKDSIILGAYVEGDNLHNFSFEHKANYLILGNEGNGIDSQLEKYVHRKLSIPKFGGAESLNVGVATAIFCDAWVRDKTKKVLPNFE